MKKLIRRIAHALVLAFALAIGAAADAQGINHCLDVAGGYLERFEPALNRADARHCEAYQEAIAVESKAVQQFRACLPGAQPGRQADLVRKAIQAAERATTKAQTAARQDGCTVR